jgi:hypothetical protein
VPNIESPYGIFSFPDPRDWPADAVRWFERVTGSRELRDVFIFDYGDVSAMYMEDSLTAAATLPLVRAEWFTERGFPAFVFSSRKIGQHRRDLEDAGYRVNLMAPADQVESSEGANVICISQARRIAAGRRHKWA